MNPTVNVDYILQGSTATERFNRFKSQIESLAGTHQPAIFPPVTGDGIIGMEVPSSCQVILAPKHIDGNGWKIKLKCNYAISNPWLFYIRQNSGDAHREFLVTPEQVDTGDYSLCDPELRTGKKLLIVEDKRVWAYRTDTNETAPVYRSDAILLVDGKPSNTPIQPYDNSESALSSYVFYQDDEPVLVENLTLIRDATSTQVFGLVTVRGYDDVTFRNITVKFSNNSSSNPTTGFNQPLSGDKVFSVNECTNVLFDRVEVYGTYSLQNLYGYAFYITNVTNITFNNVVGEGIWGVMGTHCVNNQFVYGGRLNRFDVHYYGKNARLCNVIFENTVYSPKNFNRVGMFYGSLIFDNCTFNAFIPLNFDPSYHVYTGFELALINCTMDSCSGHIINAGEIEPTATLRRKSLSKMCWPNVHIIKMQFFTLPSQLTVFHLDSNANLNVPISYITDVTIHLDSTYSNLVCKYCNYASTHVENALTTRYCTGDKTIQNLPTV